jgi:hypothetical protein
MHKNGKMRHVESIPVIGGGGLMDNDRGSEFNYDIF